MIVQNDVKMVRYSDYKVLKDVNADLVDQNVRLRGKKYEMIDLLNDYRRLSKAASTFSPVWDDAREKLSARLEKLLENE